MRYRFADPWHAYLPREGGHVVSLFGGGGKTRLSRLFAAVLAAEGVPVILTTTTRSEPLDWPELVPCDLDREAIPRSGIPFLHRGVDRAGKWLGLAPEEVDDLAEAGGDRVLIVEADGSAGHPVKLHREGEPVWPGRTSLAVAVLGLSALGRPVREVLHRHGSIAAPWLDDPADDLAWSWALMRVLAGAYLARVPSGVPAVAALTQMDRQRDAIGLFGFVDGLLREAVPLVTLAALTEDLRVQTVYLGETADAGADAERRDGR